MAETLHPWEIVWRTINCPFRFRLATLLAVVAVSSLAFAINSKAAWRQKRAVAALEDQEVAVYFAHEVDDAGEPRYMGALPQPEILAEWLGVHYLSSAASVDAWNCLLDDETFAQIGELPKVRWLTCQSIDDEQLGRLAGLKRLQALRVKRAFVSDRGMQLLKRHGRLQVLDFPQAEFGADGLAALAECRQLEELKLSGAAIDERGLDQLARLRNLKQLDLSAATITDEGIARLEALLSLVALDVSHTGASDDGLIALENLHKLRVFSAAETRLGDRGAAVLATLTELQTLNLSGTDIGDNGMESLARLPKLRSLDIRHTPVSDRGLAAIAKSKSLQVVNLEGCPISADGLDRLVLDPNCTALFQFGGAVDLTPSIERLKARYPMMRVAWTLKSVRAAPRLDLPEDYWRPYAKIDDNDPSTALWERALTLHYVNDPSVPREAINALFAAAVTRGAASAPLWLAWGDCSPSSAASDLAREAISLRLPEHPYSDALRELVLRELSDEYDPQALCYAAAAAIDPQCGAAWLRLANRPFRAPIRAAADIALKVDPENGLAHWSWALANRRQLADHELLDRIASGCRCKKFDHMPTPLPPHVTAAPRRDRAATSARGNGDPFALSVPASRIVARRDEHFRQAGRVAEMLWEVGGDTWLSASNQSRMMMAFTAAADRFNRSTMLALPLLEVRLNGILLAERIAPLRGWCGTGMEAEPKSIYQNWSRQRDKETEQAAPRRFSLHRLLFDLHEYEKARADRLWSSWWSAGLARVDLGRQRRDGG